MSYQTPHRKYLDLASATTGIRGRSVLEVGGSTPPHIALSYSPAEWTCANLSTQAVAESNLEARNLGSGNYTALCQDITSFERNDSYDLVYSINAFEHIHDLDVAFGKMRRALKPGGYLFTLFGPIWSSDVGHHLSITTEDKRELLFFEGVLAPWEHLTSTREAIYAKLALQHGEITARKAVSYIFDYHDLNRLFEHDYLRIVRESGLTPVLLLRNRKGHPPDVPGATSTREFLMVLKKGSVTPLERVSRLARFAFTFGCQQIEVHLARRS